MNDRTLGIAAVCLGMGLQTAVAHGGDDTAFLPDTSVSLRAARYANSAPNFQETGWIGAGAGLVEAYGTTAYFTAQVETVIGDVIRPVDPNQANYHLELGFDHPFGAGKRLNPFFHHVSRHLVDRPKTDTVDWNVLGVRGETELGFMPGHLIASIGHTTRTSLVGYDWEFIARLEGHVFPSRSAGPYYDSGARLVTTTPSVPYPRSSFLDGFVEAGWRWTKTDRRLDLFLAFWHQNDVELLIPASRDSLLFGFHIGAGPSREPWYWR
jgi:hypothetical protein